ncbi:MAG: SNF2-related protein, partial [Peptostreptococcaceae bacterium]
MDTQMIKNIIDFNTDRARYSSGFTSYKRNLVKDSYAKEENNICTFYGTVNDEYTRQNYTSLMMINNKTRAIVNCSCDCKDFISKDNQPKICSHIVATVLKGIDSIENQQPIEEEENDSIIDPSLTLTINQSRGGFLGLDLDIDGVNKIEFRKIFNSYKEKKKLHRLSSGGYLNIENEDLQKSFKIIDSLGIYFDFDNMKIPNNKSMYLENLIEQEELSFVNGQKYVSNIAKRYKKITSSKYELPSEINVKLRDYQIEGYNFLRTLAEYEFGGILADEMGLGKTLQSITFLVSQKGKKNIVITPTALIYNWANEINKFAPTLKVAVVHGNKSIREELIKNYKEYDVILTTYSTYRNDKEKYENIEFDYCFIDEAQNIKNSDSI